MRAAFAIVTAALLLTEIALTRLFSGTIGYYFAFMSISVAMLGLGAGSLWVTLRGDVGRSAEQRAGYAAFGLGASLAGATLAYLRFYPAMGNEGVSGLAAYVGIFVLLFVPFLFGGIVTSVVFEANKQRFSQLYAIDLAAAALGCVVAVVLLDAVPAPRALLAIAAFSGLASPLFLRAAGKSRAAAVAAAAVVALVGLGTVTLRDSSLFAARVIRNHPLPELVRDRWNDFSRIIVKRGPFYTWGLSDTYTTPHEAQYDLLIEGVAGTQIQRCDHGDVASMDFFDYDIASLPHRLRTSGSTLVLGVGAGFDVLMAKHFGKAPIVGVEVNPLVGELVNRDFGDYTSRPYEMPGVTVHFENARTFVKRDHETYDIVTVTWVDSGAATGAGAFALTENYLYTVDAFRDYLARLDDDGVLAFMRSRFSPIFDAIKGIGIAVEAMRQMGIEDPSRNIVVSSVASPHFGYRELVHVMLKRQPFTAAEIATIDELRTRLHFKDLYTPGRVEADGPIRDLIVRPDREAVYASFPFDMEPNSDDRPFYFFLRSGKGREAGRDVKVLTQAIGTIALLILALLVPPLVALYRRRSGGSAATTTATLLAPTAYFGLLGLGFMLIEMKLLQQSGLVVGNPTLSLAAVLGALLLSTGLGALASPRVAARGWGVHAFVALVALLLVALVTSNAVASWLTGFALVPRTAGLVLAIAPLGFLLGLPLPLGMAKLGDEPGLTAWSWGINGMFGVAGSAVAIYVGIYEGLTTAFLIGVLCYVAAGGVYLLAFARPRARAPLPGAGVEGRDGGADVGLPTSDRSRQEPVT
jgi:hypothetical protein